MQSPQYDIGSLGDGSIIRLVLMLAILVVGFLLVKKLGFLPAILSGVMGAWRWLNAPKAAPDVVAISPAVAAEPADLFTETQHAVDALRTINRVLEARGMSADSRDEINQAAAPFIFDFTGRPRSAAKRPAAQTPTSGEPTA